MEIGEFDLMDWTDEKISELTGMWSAGLTAGAIGKQLGITKNAVVGKVHRLGLKSRPSPIRQKSIAKHVAEKPAPRIFTLADMSPQTCRWPSGDPKHADFRCCGRRVSEGKPYCPEHCDIAYVKYNKVAVG
jgi:GcrA cell cycle regulator